MTEKLMREKEINSTEKIFLGFLEVLTVKGEYSTDKSNQFFAEKIGKSSTYIASMVKRLSKLNIIRVSKKYGRRDISLDDLYIKNFMNEKREK